MILSVPVTHSDWMLRADLPMTADSVRYMLDECKASGWTRIYWRLFDGGRTNYHSRLADPAGKWDEDNYYNPKNPADVKHTYWWENPERDRDPVVAGLAKLEYSGLDTLAEAVAYGRSIGLEIHAWLTLNEDDHGWGQQSRFTKANPHSRWRKRDGTFYYSQQSFAFPEVRKYKLALVRELLENYEIDGLFLDWMRTGDVRDDPQQDEDGVADFGYEEPLVASFKEKYGVDPHAIPNDDERWVAWRAQPQTEFMREARKLMKSLKPELPLAVMGQNPWSYRGSGHKIDGNLRGLLLDTATWAREGLMDAAVAAGYYRDGGDARQAYEWLRAETQGLLDVWLYEWVPNTPSEFDQNLALAEELGAPQILFWEGDYIDARENKRELQAHMREAVMQARA
jgi:hypothetical protein